jgi:hypothetical protein
MLNGGIQTHFVRFKNLGFDLSNRFSLATCILRNSFNKLKIFSFDNCGLGNPTSVCRIVSAVG